MNNIQLHPLYILGYLCHMKHQFVTNHMQYTKTSRENKRSDPHWRNFDHRDVTSATRRNLATTSMRTTNFL